MQSNLSRRAASDCITEIPSDKVKKFHSKTEFIGYIWERGGAPGTTVI